MGFNHELCKIYIVMLTQEVQIPTLISLNEHRSSVLRLGCNHELYNIYIVILTQEVQIPALISLNEHQQVNIIHA